MTTKTTKGSWSRVTDFKAYRGNAIWEHFERKKKRKQKRKEADKK